MNYDRHEEKDKLIEILGESLLLDELVSVMSTSEAKDNFNYIRRMHGISDENE